MRRLLLATAICLLMIGIWGLILVIALILSPLMLVDWAERKWSNHFPGIGK